MLTSLKSKLTKILKIILFIIILFNYKLFYNFSRIFPQGRDKTDFNFFRISFSFTDKASKKPFEMIFELSHIGLLKTNNVNEDTFFLG